MKIIILIPIYNDWQSVSKLIDDINLNIAGSDNEISIIIVNDASNYDRQNEEKNLENIHSIKILNMKINQGHSRCIATGLKYIYEKEDFDYVIPMDGDGEDRPDEISKFIESTDYYVDKAIVGERIKRSEGSIFTFFYIVHKFLTYFFTGKSIKFGNFTCLPKSVVKKFIIEKSSWNSFSGSLVKIEKSFGSIKSTRGKRYFGPSKMSFLNLVKHSLSIISVFKFNVIVRSILFFVIYFAIINKNISLITIFPLFLLILFLFIIFNLSNRENIKEFNASLSNIGDVRQY